MRNYKMKILASKQGKKPARMGVVEVKATSKQEALEKATAECSRLYNNLCETIGHIPNPTLRVWAEFA